MRVQVYRNLHKKCYSVRSKATGRVIAHVDEINLKKVRFIVQEGGRQRVIREGRKNVHAFIEGEILLGIFPVGQLQKIHYNPYKYDSFMLMNDIGILGAEQCKLDKKGVWI